MTSSMYWSFRSSVSSPICPIMSGGIAQSAAVVLEPKCLLAEGMDGCARGEVWQKSMPATHHSCLHSMVLSIRVSSCVALNSFVQPRLSVHQSLFFISLEQRWPFGSTSLPRGLTRSRLETYLHLPYSARSFFVQH